MLLFPSTNSDVFAIITYGRNYVRAKWGGGGGGKRNIVAPESSELSPFQQLTCTSVSS